ncbi:hypothetical protein ACQEVB_20565 [Pseudonocardia sp. CA-107938]|uniref:hypothetical protein n=1 Tax=Pseudonocardia sp. CA-107938 TaxID=3240021 RepID=UPI003D91DA47
MEAFMTFMLMRALLIGLVIVGVAVLVAVVVVLAKRAGRLDDAKRLAAPIARAAGNRGGAIGAVGRGAAHYLEHRDEQR